MNVILIIADTVRHDYLGCYGNTWVATPHLDRLAGESAVMERFFTGSFPTGPMRKDVHAGRFTFTYANWGAPRPAGELVLAELLRDAGYTTAYIGDTNNSSQYMDGFEHQEIVPNAPARLGDVPEEVPLPAHPDKLRLPMHHAMAIARQARAWDGEAERRAPRTAQAAHRWLEDHQADAKPFFLWVDTFDPHEPWDPPRYYIDRYDKGYQGEELMEPAYAPAGYASEDEIRHMRCMYAAKLTMVDRWLGFLLDGIRHMGLEQDTAVLFTSDHGFYHGEHGFIGKVELDREGKICRRWPLYSTIAHPPLMIKLPGGPAGRRFGAFCQPPDITATILDLAGVPRPGCVQGESLLPVVRGDEEAIRDHAVSSLTYVTDDKVRCPTSFRTEDYLYIYGGDEWESELYDLHADPDESCNIIQERKDIARELHEAYVEFLKRIDCPAVSLAARSDFPSKPRTEIPYERLI